MNPAPPQVTQLGYGLTQLTPPDATLASPYQPPMAAPPPPPSPPPPPPSGPNLPLIIGIAAAVLVLLILVGVGGVYLYQRAADITPTVTVAGQVTPTITPTSAAAVSSPGASASGSASGIGTPTIPPRSVTATAAAASDPARTQVATGDAALQEGQFPQAVEAYKAGLAASPQSAIANRQLGLALWVWNHDPGEIGYLDQATKLDPNDALAWAYLSFSSVDTHQVERAYAAAQRAVAANDREAVAYAAIANAYVRYPPEPANPESGKGEARQAIERAKQLDPDNLWVLWVEHVVLANEEQYEAALAPIDKMIAQRPNWATLYYAKGGVYHWLERPGDARTWQEKALSVDPDYPYALTELGWLAYEDGDFARAKGFFERALALTDDVNDSAHIGLGYTLSAQGDFDNAIRHCQRAVTIESRQAGGFSCLGRLYREGTRQYEESLAAYRKVLELRPYWEDGHVGVALVQADQRKYTEAEATLKQGLNQVTKPKYIHYWLGWVLYQQGKYQEAQANFEQAAKHAPDDAVVHFQLGQNLEQLQRFPEARAAYERALAINPNYDEARKALDRLAQQGR
jgi:tetratricopeptide (TPR) repeat protein